VIKGMMPFDHDRRERSINLGVANNTPAAFGTFWLHQKVLAATRQCVLRKKAFIGGETISEAFANNLMNISTINSAKVYPVTMKP